MSIVYIRFPLGFPLAWVDRRQEDMPRESLLERLLAGAEAGVHCADWRDDAWQLLQASSPPSGPPLPLPAPGDRPAAGPALLFTTQGASSDGYACVASPLHCVAGMTNVHLPVGGLLSLTATEAGALAQDFSRVFADGSQRLVACADGTLCCWFDRAVDASTCDPERVVGRDIGLHLPQGPDGRRLRALISEIEMWLFEHPVNSARAGRGELPITSLWFWDGGPALNRLPTLPAWIEGRDVLFSAWSSARTAAGRGSGLILGEAAPGTAAWREFESGHLMRLLSDLRSGQVSRLELSAGERRYSLGPLWRWRFWRRPRPWWEFFDEGAAAG